MLTLLLKSPPDWLPFLFIGIAAIAVLAGVLWSRRAERKRRDAFAAAAMQIGFSFEPEAQPFAADAAARFHLFTTGHGKQFRNVLRGRKDSKDVLVFDYKYVTGNGKNQSTHLQTVAAFSLESADLPGFSVQPENLLHKIAAAFGQQDIDFPEHPEFSRRYLLRGKDEAAIRGLFSPVVIAMFESLAADTRWNVEGGGDWLLVYRGGSKVNPTTLPEFLQETATVASTFGKSTGAAKFGF